MNGYHGVKSSLSYNDGFAGVKGVFEILRVNVGPLLPEKCIQPDYHGILRSEGYVAKQQKRYAK